jgi:hypothetical protein
MLPPTPQKRQKEDTPIISEEAMKPMITMQQIIHVEVLENTERKDFRML